VIKTSISFSICKIPDVSLVNQTKEDNYISIYRYYISDFVFAKKMIDIYINNISITEKKIKEN